MYGWSPVWLVWIQLFYFTKITIYFKDQTNPVQKKLETNCTVILPLQQVFSEYNINFLLDTVLHFLKLSRSAFLIAKNAYFLQLFTPQTPTAFPQWSLMSLSAAYYNIIYFRSLTTFCFLLCFSAATWSSPTRSNFNSWTGDHTTTKVLKRPKVPHYF